MKTKMLTQSITRPGDTTQYAANDVIGTLMAFRGVSAFKDSGGLIQSAVLLSSQNAATKLDADLLLFSESFAIAADNSPFDPTDAQLEKLVGVITFPQASAKAGNAGAGAVGNAFCAISAVGVPAPSEVYGVLIARNAYSPVASEVLTLSLGVIQSQVD